MYKKITLILLVTLICSCAKYNKVDNTKKNTFSEFSELLKTKVSGNLTNISNNEINIQKFNNDLIIILPTNIFFQTNSYQFNQDKTDILYTLADVVNSYSNEYEIYISGHSNYVESIDKLSLYRARQIASILWMKGTNPNNLIVKGFNNKYNIVKSSSMDLNMQNARVEIRIANMFL